jgi:hypothetical protein
MTRKARPGELNYALVDRYTAAHAAVGFILGAGRISVPKVAAFAVAWEVAERPLKDAFPELFPSQTQDSLQNATGDAISMVLGRLLWSWLEPRA